MSIFDNLSKTEKIYKPFVRCHDCGKKITFGLKRTRWDFKGRMFVDYICHECIANPPKKKDNIVKQRIGV